MDQDVWVSAAQIVSGVAALVAVWIGVVTVRSARRVPLTDTYMSGWQSIIDVLTVASERRESPPPEETADELIGRFRSADQKLAVVEATLGVRLYGREIRHDLHNLLVDVLYDNPNIRGAESVWLGLIDVPRPEWAECSDEDWVRVVNSVPFNVMFASELWSLPGQPEDLDGLMRWYYPVVLHGLGARDSVTSPHAAPQQQLSFMLSAYVDAFVLPWVRDASREALMGRLGVRGRLALQRKWRRQRSLRGLSRGHGWSSRGSSRGTTMFDPTDRSLS